MGGSRVKTMKPSPMAAIHSISCRTSWPGWFIAPISTPSSAVRCEPGPAVEEVDPAAITEDEARRAGVASLDRLHRLLDRRPGAHVFRMRVRPAGPDPRVALREQAELSEADRRAVDARLDRWDAARDAPWTREVLRLIAGRPAVRAPDLAASLGRETLAFNRGGSGA